MDLAVLLCQVLFTQAQTHTFSLPTEIKSQPSYLQLEEEIQAIHAIMGFSPGVHKQSSEVATQ